MKLCFLTDHACILVIESFVDINPCFRDLLLHIKLVKYQISTRDGLNSVLKKSLLSRLFKNSKCKEQKKFKVVAYSDIR